MNCKSQRRDECRRGLCLPWGEPGSETSAGGDNTPRRHRQARPPGGPPGPMESSPQPAWGCHAARASLRPFQGRWGRLHAGAPAWASEPRPGHWLPRLQPPRRPPSIHSERGPANNPAIVPRSRAPRRRVECAECKVFPRRLRNGAGAETVPGRLGVREAGHPRWARGAHEARRPANMDTQLSAGRERGRTRGGFKHQTRSRVLLNEQTEK